MAFNERSFQKRFEKMGDAAEAVFEETYSQGWVRLGLNRPPLNMGMLPPFIRFMPDYLTSKGLVEVQGFGRDQTAKFKLKKIGALLEWQDHFRVDFFVWDSHNQRYGWVRLPELWAALETAEVRVFENDGNEYFAVPADELPVVEWVEHGEPLAVAR